MVIYCLCAYACVTLVMLNVELVTLYLAVVFVVFHLVLETLKIISSIPYTSAIIFALLNYHNLYQIQSSLTCNLANVMLSFLACMINDLELFSYFFFLFLHES